MSIAKTYLDHSSPVQPKLIRNQFQGLTVSTPSLVKIKIKTDIV